MPGGLNNGTFFLKHDKWLSIRDNIHLQPRTFFFFFKVFQRLICGIWVHPDTDSFLLLNPRIKEISPPGMGSSGQPPHHGHRREQPGPVLSGQASCPEGARRVKVTLLAAPWREHHEWEEACFHPTSFMLT